MGTILHGALCNDLPSGRSAGNFLDFEQRLSTIPEQLKKIVINNGADFFSSEVVSESMRTEVVLQPERGFAL